VLGNVRRAYSQIKREKERVHRKRSRGRLGKKTSINKPVDFVSHLTECVQDSQGVGRVGGIWLPALNRKP